MVAVGGLKNGGGKTTRGQLGRNENMIQSGFIGLSCGGVLERKVMFGGASQGTIEVKGKAGGQFEPAVGLGQLRGPVNSRVRTAVPVADNKRAL
jgi:hypothetical protein